VLAKGKYTCGKVNIKFDFKKSGHGFLHLDYLGEKIANLIINGARIDKKFYKNALIDSKVRLD
jgi:hypothetical protein